MPDFRAGYAVSLSREEARDVFGCRSDEALRATVGLVLAKHLAGAPSGDETPRVICCFGAWKVQQALLNSVGGEEALLRQALTGGRPLSQAEDQVVRVVRPDIVPQIADALESLPREKLTAAFESGSDAEKNLRAIEQLTQLYRAAAGTGMAVLFVADDVQE